MSATALDVDSLEDLLTDTGIEIPCGHSQHFSRQGEHHDDGPAVYWCQVTHDCPKRPGTKGTIYPACKAYGMYCIRDAYNWWRCARCEQTTLVCNAVITVGFVDKDR